MGYSKGTVQDRHAKEEAQAGMACTLTVERVRVVVWHAVSVETCWCISALTRATRHDLVQYCKRLTVGRAGLQPCSVLNCCSFQICVAKHEPGHPEPQSTCQPAYHPQPGSSSPPPPSRHPPAPHSFRPSPTSPNPKTPRDGIDHAVNNTLLLTS
jgi:hypothetical protein